MRILHVFDHSLPLHSGYSFRSRSILLEQKKRGWETIHLTTPRHYHAGPDPEEASGLLFHRTQYSKGIVGKIPVLSELAEVRATARSLEALVIQTKPDIIHAHSPVLTALAAGMASRRTNLPLVYEIRAFWEDAAAAHGTCREGGLRYRATRWLETYVAKSADAVGVICQGLLNELCLRGIDQDKLFVVPNAVNLNEFGDGKIRDAKLAAEIGLGDAEVIGFVGSFYDYEGLDILLEAMPGLIARRPKIQLLLVGGGPAEAALKRQASTLHMSSRVHFIGRIPQQEVERYYNLIDVLVYPRKKMRLTDLVTPLKPLEAMAGRKLVAASNVGGHQELIKAGVTGSLFAADDPKAIVESISGLLENMALSDGMRQNARQYVSEERTWAQTVARYEPVYLRLLAARGM